MFSKRVRVILILFAIFFVFAVVYLPGFSKYQELKKKESDITKEIERLGDESLQLVQEEKRLESDSEYLEKVAREDLGRVRPGEVVYKILPVPKNQSNGNLKEQENRMAPST